MSALVHAAGAPAWWLWLRYGGTDGSSALWKRRLQHLPAVARAVRRRAWSHVEQLAFRASGAGLTCAT